MSKNLSPLITFPFSNTGNGTLAMFQAGKTLNSSSLPFEVKRVLVMKNMKTGDTRGGHTHHQTRQILVALEGGCVVELDNGKEKSSVTLNTFSQGLLLEPYIWHTMKDFLPGTILLVLASTSYDEKDYIRSYEDFLKCIK